MTEADHGIRWRETAGAWADEPISRFALRDVSDFVIKEDRREDVEVDPRRIVGTDHGRYNQGMTWRAFLRDGKKMTGKLEALRNHPEFYDDPTRLHYGRIPDGWTLYEIDGDYFIAEGNHRSVIVKFRAMEDGVLRQRIPLVIALTLDHMTRSAMPGLEAMLRDGQEAIPARMQTTEDGVYPRRFDTGVRLLGLGEDPREIFRPARARDIIEQKNRWRYRIEGATARISRWGASE